MKRDGGKRQNHFYLNDKQENSRKKGWLCYQPYIVRHFWFRQVLHVTIFWANWLPKMIDKNRDKLGITSWSGHKVAVKLSEVVHTVWSFRVKHKLHTQHCIQLRHCKSSYTKHFPLNLWRQSKISWCIPRFRPANRLRRKSKAVRKVFPLKCSENEIFLPLDRVGQIPFIRHCSSIPTGDWLARAIS